MDNFITLFGDSLFWASLRNTAYFAVVVVPVQAGLALVLALLVNAKVRGTELLPHRVLRYRSSPRWSSISLLWRFIYQPDGLLNQLISAVSFGHWHGTDWLNNPDHAMPAIMVMSIWQAVGFHMIVWLAGLQTIPRELYEAAALDGASGWKTFRQHHLARTAGDADLHPDHHHHRGVQPVHPDQRDDPGRTAGPHHDRRLHGGANRLRAAVHRLRGRGLTRLLRAGAGGVRRPAIPDPGEGLT